MPRCVVESRMTKATEEKCHHVLCIVFMQSKKKGGSIPCTYIETRSRQLDACISRVREGVQKSPRFGKNICREQFQKRYYMKNEKKNEKENAQDI